ncbi:MAG: BREX-4 system phosphatase PglZ [Lachnospiraceae bacterium]|nr:BREX-4 system phosphatase PglZ [Lachnospiraceae bacterium]
MEAVREYLSNTGVNAPFFLVAGDRGYQDAKGALEGLLMKPLPVSAFCGAPDKRPNLDSLLDEVAFGDIDAKSADKRIFVTGLGEYLALRGEKEARSWLSRIKDMKVGNARVVFLLRGVERIVRSLQREDPTRFDRRRVFFCEDTESDIHICLVPGDLDLPAADGMKGMLSALAGGEAALNVKTNAVFHEPMLSVRSIKSAYDGIKQIAPGFQVPESCGTDDQWRAFLANITKAGGGKEAGALVQAGGVSAATAGIEAPFAQFAHPGENLYAHIKGDGYEHWLYFIWLKVEQGKLPDGYLRYVMEMTQRPQDLKQNVLDAIMGIPHTDSRFPQFYAQRKAFLKDFPASEIAAFVSRNRMDTEESLYRLTDLTLVERCEFIAWFSRPGGKALLAQAGAAYPALADYLRRYDFADSAAGEKLNALFSDYFDRYKWQKTTNTLESDFLAQVESLAVERVYNVLPTRNEIIGKLDADGTALCWIDALGVEFLGFIQRWCEREGLRLRIHVAQADLPTITSINSGFYTNDWQGPKLPKEGRLDELKHKATSRYDYSLEKLPIHLAEELGVIADCLETVSAKLWSREYRRVVIASDHGASRLAVISGQEEKYDTDTKGEHGGRCCRKGADFSPTQRDLPFATEGNGFIVLANYGRFRGSRRQNVEVHGGASLEEVLVPVIELTLTKPEVVVELMHPDAIIGNFRKKAAFTLFCETQLGDVRVTVGHKTYPAEKVDGHHYRVATDIGKAGEYPAEVFDGDNPVGRFTVKVQGGAGENSGFDSLFQ